MMSTKDVVVKYRPSRVNDITDQQIAYIPRLEIDQVECSMPYYVLEGRKVTLNPKSHIIFKLRYLHFNGKMNSIKRRNHRSCNKPFADLVYGNVLKPFMLFINRLFIPWEAINIVINNDDFYLIVNGSKIEALRSLCKSYDLVQIFSIPETMVYISGKQSISADNLQPAFMFDNSLMYTNNFNNANYAIVIDYGIRHKFKSEDLYTHLYMHTVANAMPIYQNDEKIKISEKNIFLFVDGRLHYGEPQPIKRCTVNGDHLSYHYSNNNTWHNIPVRVDGNLLSINNGIYQTGLNLSVVFFKNSYFTSNNLDNIMRISEESREDGAVNLNRGNSLPYFQQLSEPFDLPIDQAENFDSNIALSESCIMGYNPYLYNKLVKSYSAINIQEFTGSEVLKTVKEHNALSIGLDNNGVYEERLLLFVNGILHPNHDLSVLNKNTIDIPIGTTISENDIVEFMRFRNVNNNEISIVINEDDGFIHQCDHNINHNMRIFCRTANNGYYYPEDGSQQFEVEYTLEQDENGLARIVLSDQFYYGKNLTIVSNNRFAHKTFIIEDDNKNSIIMHDHFRFCTDENRYMVFINGRLANRDRYNIAIPCDPSSKEFMFVLLLDPNPKINIGDRIDVVYSSTDLEDFITQERIDRGGDIVVTNPESMDYVFSKELYMVWLNGKKIPESQLDDINSTCIRLNTDQSTINNLRVIKYIKCSTLTSIHHNSTDWDRAIFDSGYTYDEINKIIGKKSITLTNTEPNYNSNNADLVIGIHNNVLILSDDNNNMIFHIIESSGILEEPAESLTSRISNNTLYIK